MSVTTTGELLSVAARAGLTAEGPRITAAVETAGRLRASKSPAPALGGSKLGGVPDLPSDSAWPRAPLYDRPDEPMTFIGQLEISRDLRHELPTFPIQAPGLLSCFCLKDDQTDEIFGYAKVIASSGRDVLRPHQPPEDLAAGNRLGPVGVHIEPMLTLPSPGSKKFADLGIEDHRAYERVLVALGYAHPQHRLFGHPTVHQNDVLSDAARMGARRIDPGIGHVRWKLLLQVDYDYEGLGVGFGDGGTLYFCLPEADLAAGRLDRVVALGQSG